MNDNKAASHTIAFLRMAAVEICRMVDQHAHLWPENDRAEMRHLADQCEREAEELERTIQKAD